MFITKTFVGSTVLNELPHEIKTNSSQYEIGIIECFALQKSIKPQFLCCKFIEVQYVDDEWRPLLAILDCSRLGQVSVPNGYFPILTETLDQLELDCPVKILLRLHIRYK